MVDTSTRQNEPDVPADPARVDKTQYRPIRIIGLLLILQALGLAGIGAYEIASVDWEELASIEEDATIDLDRIDLTQPPESRLEALVQQAAEAVVFVVFFLPPAFMMLLSGFSFLLLKRRGWLLAAIAQGLSLGASLFFYSEMQSGFIYPIMLYCILMILYLNSQDVRVVFHSRRDPAEQSLETTHGS